LSLRFGIHGERTGAIAALRELGSYQCGRGIVYMSCGAAAGLLGAAVASTVRSGAVIVAALMACGFVIAAIAPWLNRSRTTAPMAGVLARFLAPLARLRQRHPTIGLILTGMAFAGLPCGI